MWVVPLLSLPGNDHVIGFKSIWLKVIIHRQAIYQFNITLDLCNVIHIRKGFVLFVVLQTNSPNFYKPAVLKADSSNINKAPILFAVLKTDSLNFNKPPTSFAALKTDYSNFNKPPIYTL